MSKEVKSSKSWWFLHNFCKTSERSRSEPSPMKCHIQRTLTACNKDRGAFISIHMFIEAGIPFNWAKWVAILPLTSFSCFFG